MTNLERIRELRAREDRKETLSHSEHQELANYYAALHAEEAHALEPAMRRGQAENQALAARLHELENLAQRKRDSLHRLEMLIQEIETIRVAEKRLLSTTPRE